MRKDSRPLFFVLDLRECEYIVSLLERIKVKGKDEAIRPRAIYFDDKHQEFTVFAGYLVPIKQDASLSPKDFNAILNDGQGLHSDRGTMWYITYWDIKIQRIIPTSDHFDLDHYDFYNPVRGNFEIGACRGDRTIGEMSEYGGQWR